MSTTTRHTLSVFTENHVGLLSRVTSVFTRRHINIESLTVSESEVKGVHRFTIVVNMTRDQADKIAAQIERQVEVLKAFVHDESQVIRRDLALFKIARHGLDEQTLSAQLDRHSARIIELANEYLVIEKTGTPEQVSALRDELEAHGLLELVRSGSVALTRPMKKLATYLSELEDAHNATW
ncbi:MAG: acetolactate synthase small subunit [Polyangiaceae bacterium]